jgi:hypothetical protein
MKQYTIPFPAFSLWKCQAYDDDGTICRLPAVAIDQERGIAVCEKHANPRPNGGNDEKTQETYTS